MIWDTLRGHDQQADMFRRAVRRNRLSHAYLLHGPGGVGKRRFARLLAQCLLCETFPDDDLDACGECANCRMMTAGTHPDFLEVRCPPGKAVLSIDLIAGDDSHRGREGLNHDLSLRPTCGNRKIAVIDDADAFNQESGNAFLKTLEEPPDYCLLLLIAAKPDALLPTIRSRCQWVRFAALNDDQVAELLLELGWAETPQAAAQLAALSDGSLETAQQLLDPKIAALRNVVLSALQRGDFHSAKLAEEVASAVKACGDTAAQRKAMAWAVRFGLDHFARQLHAVDSSPKQLERHGVVIERFAEATRQLESNAQVALVIHALFDDAARLSRV